MTYWIIDLIINELINLSINKLTKQLVYWRSIELVTWFISL